MLVTWPAWLLFSLGAVVGAGCFLGIHTAVARLVKEKRRSDAEILVLQVDIVSYILTSTGLLGMTFDVVRLSSDQDFELITEQSTIFCLFVLVAAGVGSGIARRWWSLQIKKGSA